MQTTLLALAITLILALMTALVGPYFIDWSNYRAEFEATASRLTGLEVRVAGAIDARILPTPTLVLQDVEFGSPSNVGKVHARVLRIEFELAALVRDEWRATYMRLQGAEFAFGLGDSGQLDWPAPALGRNPDTMSIQTLKVEDSRAVLADAASGSRVVLDKLEFSGEVRSFAGPVKGAGSFVVSGQQFPYRIAVSRVEDDGTVHVHVNLDPLDRPVALEADGSLRIEQGTPHFDGSMQLARAVGRAPNGDMGNIVDPIRVTSRFRGNSAAVLFEQVEFQYGLGDQAIMLRGDATLTFGRSPQFEGVMSSPEIDLDRILVLPEAARRRPLSAIKALVDYFDDMRRLPIPVKVRLSAETATLANAKLQGLKADLTSNAEGLNIETLEFRAPGSAQVRLSGRLSSISKGVAFAGPVEVETGDPQGLVTWLTDRAATPVIPAGALRMSGEIKIDSEMIVIERLMAKFDRTGLEGRLAYFWASSDRPPRLDAVLSAADIDLDRIIPLARSLTRDIAFDWPGQGSLALKVGRAIVAGIEAKSADVNIRIDTDQLEIERFALGDFGGAALAVTGHIDMHSPSTGSALTIDLDARMLDGVAALVEKFSSQAASELQRVAGRFVPAMLHCVIAVESGSTAAPQSVKLKIDGSAGSFRIDVLAEADTGGAGVTVANIVQIATGNISLTAHIDAGDGGTMVDLLGLNRLVAVNNQPGRLYLAADGPFNGDLAIDSRLTAGDLDVFAHGTLRLPGQQAPTARLALKVADAKIRMPRPGTPDRPIDAVSTALTARLTLAENTLGLSELSGKIANSAIGGELQVRLGEPIRVDGQIELDTLDLPAAIDAILGVEPRAGSGTAGWSPEPFEATLLGSVDGRISIKAARLSLTRTLAVREIRGALNFSPTQLTFEDINGVLAGGRLTGGVTFRRADGIAARGQFRLTDSDPAELIPGDGRPPLSGWLSLDLEVDGSGRSPRSLIGALRGSGTFTLHDGGIARLDPTAFDAVARAVDQGLPIEPARLRERIELALANRGLAVPLAQGTITIAEGQLGLPNIVVHARGADLTVGVIVDLSANLMDAHLKLSGSEAATPTAGGLPELAIGLNGPIDAPKRTLDVSAITNWLTLRAVEQQQKRLEALGAGRDPSAAPSVSSRPAGTVQVIGPPASFAPPPFQ